MASIPRGCTFCLVVLALVAPAAATAQLPDPPITPTVPLPLPPVPALPVQPPAVQPPTVPLPSAPAPAPAVTAPSVVQQSAPQVTGAAAATATTSSPFATRSSGGTTRAERGTARRRPAILLGFRSALPGRVQITVRQISPVCRSVGRLVVNAREGRNRVRFAGRIDGRRLRDGTYVAETPSGDIRFAIVGGRPTRDADRFAPSVCRAAASSPDSSLFATHRTSTPGQSTASGVAGEESSFGGGFGPIPDPLPRVVGTSVERAAEAALSLHPIFYLLLGFAIAALAVATVPSRAVPAPAVGAVLARRRAELTLAGSLALLAVLASYWIALISG